MNITDMSAEQLTNAIAKHLKELESSGSEYANAKAEYENLDEDKKPLLASLSQNFEGSETAKEKKALASEDYDMFKVGLNEARTRFLKTQVSWILAQKKVDIWQTLMANRREEIKKFGG